MASTSSCVTPGEIAYMSRFENSSKTAYNFSLETFKDKKLVSRMVATTAVYDTLYRWSMKNYMIRNFRGMREEIKKEPLSTPSSRLSRATS